MENTSLIPPTLYKNTGYSFDRIERKSLIIDIVIAAANLNKAAGFNASLSGEPLIIDNQCDVFLEALTTFNCKINTTANGVNMGFFLKINEFNIQSLSATDPAVSTTSSDFNAGLFIPNDAATTAVAKGATSHKSKKLNYICSINPCKLTTISGSISDVNPVSASKESGMGQDTQNPARFIAEFVFVPRN